MTPAEAIAADKALSDKPTTFTAELGAKKLTDQPCAGGSIVYHNKLTQGIEALRESFGQPESFLQGRRIFPLIAKSLLQACQKTDLAHVVQRFCRSSWTTWARTQFLLLKSMLLWSTRPSFM